MLPSDVPELRDEITALRDGHELQWRTFVDDLGAPVGVGLLRVSLLGAANSTQVWYRQGGATPAAIAGFIVDVLRRPMDRAEGTNR